jgi:hypothetical protein
MPANVALGAARKRFDHKFQLYGTGSPAADGGVEAPIGAIYVRLDGGSGAMAWMKHGLARTAWHLLGLATGTSANLFGNGSPEGVVTADVGRIYEQRDAIATDHSIWIKRSGTGNTGWRRHLGLAGSGTNSIMLGEGAIAASSGTDSIAIGYRSIASASGSIALGGRSIVDGAKASAADAIAIGGDAEATAPNAIALGPAASAQGDNSVVLGDGAESTAAADNSIAIGPGASVTEASMCVIGNGIVKVRWGRETHSVGGTPPTDVLHYVVSANGTNVAGCAWTIQGSRATGNAAPGKIKFDTSTVGGSGSTLQGVATRLTIDTALLTTTVPLDVTGAGAEYRIAGTKVVAARVTGWGTPTGTLTRTTFDASTVTLVQLGERVAALVTDLLSHGLIGA